MRQTCHSLTLKRSNQFLLRQIARGMVIWIPWALFFTFKFDTVTSVEVYKYLAIFFSTFLLYLGTFLLSKKAILNISKKGIYLEQSRFIGKTIAVDFSKESQVYQVENLEKSQFNQGVVIGEQPQSAFVVFAEHINSKPQYIINCYEWDVDDKTTIARFFDDIGHPVVLVDGEVAFPMEVGFTPKVVMIFVIGIVLVLLGVILKVVNADEYILLDSGQILGYAPVIFVLIFALPCFWFLKPAGHFSVARAMGNGLISLFFATGLTLFIYAILALIPYGTELSVEFEREVLDGDIKWTQVDEPDAYFYCRKRRGPRGEHTIDKQTLTVFKFLGATRINEKQLCKRY